VPDSRSAFRQSLPVLLTSLVNKSGSIGLSLLPVLLVERGTPTDQSSLAMGIVRAGSFFAILGAGWMGDTAGLRATLLLSFGLAALGFALLPLHLGYWVFLAAGLTAQVGHAATNSTIRLLLTQVVERRHHKEALGWMRTVNNLGQVLSFGLATLTARLGAGILVWFDGLTSLLALAAGAKLLPKREGKGTRAPSLGAVPGANGERPAGWWPFIGCTLIITSWNFMYELFMAGVAGRLKLVYPDEGLRIFSGLMVVNTVLCAGLAVVAARVLNRVVPCLVLGVALTSSGLALAVARTESVGLLFVSMLLLTLGEVVYGALAQFLLIRSVPPSKRENTVYSLAIVTANLGRVIAAALAFPLVVMAVSPAGAVAVTAGIAALSFAVLALGARTFRSLADA
jgi:predicted MFS family arabinose efflux permease